MALCTITRKAHKGQWCTFHGFDGKAYAAQIADVKRGTAVIDYRVRGRPVRAYVERSNHNRLQFTSEPR